MAAQLGEKYCFFYGTSVHCRGSKSLPLVHILSQMSRFHVFLLYVSGIHFNIILIYSHIFELVCSVRPSDPSFVFISHVHCLSRVIVPDFMILIVLRGILCADADSDSN